MKPKMLGLKQRIEKLKGPSPIKTKYGKISWGRENTKIEQVLTELNRTIADIKKMRTNNLYVEGIIDNVLKALDDERSSADVSRSSQDSEEKGKRSV